MKQIVKKIARSIQTIVCKVSGKRRKRLMEDNKQIHVMEFKGPISYLE